MFVFEEDVSIYGIDEENRVLKKANEMAEKYYKEDYELYQTLVDLSNLMGKRYERLREFESESEMFQNILIETKDIMNMDKDELVNECKSLGLKTSGEKDILKDRLVKEFERKFNY